MNAYEIEHIEKQIRADIRLRLAYADWADIERRARRERAQAVGKAIAGFFAAALAKLTSFSRQVRSTAADCTDARLRHDH
jgi:molecular chaperone GrpE (heat shock protein)